MPNNNIQLLSGKRALVTGGSRGIGRSIALALAEAGADVVLTARRQPELDVTAGEIGALGRQGIGLVCDVTAPDQVQQMARSAVDQLGGIDILVNNAGRAQSHKFLTHPDDLWHALIAVNLTSVYYVTKAIAPGMVAQDWGRIINIASIASKIGGRYIAAYAATKHGVLGLTRSLALELVEHQITVNAICPGYVETPTTEANIANIASRTGMSAAEARANLEKVSPQQRLIDPKEVAAVAIMLARDESRGITGQAINVDGGSVMW